MRAAAIKGIKKLEIKDIDEVKADGENVIVNVRKTGICGSDLHYFVAGEPKGLVMGHEFIGTVDDVGSRKDLKVGERVTALPISPCGVCPACKSGNVQYCEKTWSKAVGLSLDNPGGFTSKIKIRPDMVVKVPDEVSDDEAAMIEPTAVALHAIHLADIKVGDKVLVVGAGIIGMLSAMFAGMEGASYVAVSEANVPRGKKAFRLGVADRMYDAKDTKMLNKMRYDTIDGFDVVIECCGNSPAVSSAIAAVKPGGTVVLVGVSLGTVTIPSIAAVTKELTIKGAIAYNEEEFKTCIDLMATKKIDVLKFLDRVISLNEIQDAFLELTSGKSATVKIIVDHSKEDK